MEKGASRTTLCKSVCDGNQLTADTSVLNPSVELMGISMKSCSENESSLNHNPSVILLGGRGDDGEYVDSCE